MAGATSDNSPSATEDEDTEAQSMLAEAAGDDGEQDASQDSEAELGDAGKRALDAMKQKYRSERDKRKSAEEERDKLRQPDNQDGEVDAESIRREAEKAATSKANTRIVRSEIKAAAAGKFSDPSDALRFLDLEQFEVNDDGEVDADEITDALDDVLKSKPYLAAQGGKRFEGTAEGGARKGSTEKPQLSHGDLKDMSRAQINKARKDGRLDQLMGKKS